MSKDLPSIDDFGADENLPSVEDFITEEKAEELPSVEDFIEKEEEVIEEATQTIEDADGNSFAEVKDIVPPWPELVRMINDVRSDIPDIPEVKYYDQELQDLAEQISKLPEVRYYDREVEAICEQIDAVREQVKDLPEVKYYDEQVDAIEDRIDSLQTDVANLPEVKYYDAEIEAICEAIDQVKASIPKFPKWVNEVNEVPDFSWIGKTFSVIDDDFVKVNDTIDTLRERVDYNLKELSEDIDKKKFEAKVELDTKSEEIEAKIKEEKDKIWKEMRESSLRIWEYHKEFKDDDRKLKKQILGEYNSLKESIDKKVNEFNENSVKTDKLLLDYFEDLRNQISSLPEVKYYDKDIDYVKTDIKDLYKLVGDIKSSQKKLQEEQQLLSETNVQFGEDPPNTSNTDPLTPLDQNFVTLDQLQQHYKTFVQRVQYQLSSIGGGGAGFIRDLDDVTFDESTGENKLLIYNGTKWVGIASTALSGGSGGDADSASKLVLDVRNNNIGYALTIGTPVYQTAYNSGLDRLDVEESRASNSTTMPAKGVVSADLANNDNGQIIVYGELEGVNTQAFDVGDELFVASGGGLTNVRPTDPTHLVQKIAVVLKKSTANGAILVYGAGRTNDVPNNISIAGSVTAADGFFSGNVTIGGTVTYEDVKNVDSLGIVTARTGIDVLAGGINVTGVSTFVGDANFDNATLYVDSVNNRLGVGLNNPAVPLHVFGSYPTLKIQNSATAQYASASIDLQGPAGDERYTKILHGNSNTGGTETYFQIEQYDGSGSYVKQIAHYNYQNDYWNFLPAGTERLRVNTGGIDVTGHTETDTLNVTGVSTISTGIGTVYVGTGNTTLIVQGDARITGILTIGTASVTIDGDSNTVSVGIVTITNSEVILGDNVSINASATGINSAPNVLYVAKDGIDTNNGTSIDNAFLTIAAAVGAATSGTVVKVLSGNYVESNPIELPAFVGVVGDDQRTVKVLPSNTTQDIFHVNKGCKIANMTFSGHLAPAAAVAFPTGIATNVGGGKWKGPYIQNCTSDTTTGTGIYIDGDKAVKTKSMNVDAFTQYNQGGVGVAVTNEGYAQLVSVFTICCNEAITVHKGGQADLANSNCSFGTYGLVADGVSPEQFTGSVGIATRSTSTDYSEVTLSNLSPFSPQLFNQTYTRQSTGFVLSNASVSSGSARIHADSNYYYYVSSTGSNNTSRALIFSEVDNRWVTIFTYSINFTSIYDNQPIGSVYTDNVTTSSTTADGRNVPTASSSIVYATSSGPYVGTGTAVAGQDNVIVNVGAVTTRPYDGQVVYFDKLYKSVETITITSGGSGYTSTPSVTISSPSGPNGEVATAFATIENGVVTEIDIISSGSQYDPTDTVTVTISAPDSGTTATATANLADTYYTINSSTPITAGITTLTLAENLLNTVGVGSTAYFFQQSKIIASSHTFEYIGSGNDITTATPKRGGVTIQANEVVTQNGGSVIYTSTDQAGNFRIGDEFQINQNTGTISGRAFSKSLFSEMTPFILALS